MSSGLSRYAAPLWECACAGLEPRREQAKRDSKKCLSRREQPGWTGATGADQASGKLAVCARSRREAGRREQAKRDILGAKSA